MDIAELQDTWFIKIYLTGLKMCFSMAKVIMLN